MYKASCLAVTIIANVLNISNAPMYGDGSFRVAFLYSICQHGHLIGNVLGKKARYKKFQSAYDSHPVLFNQRIDTLSFNCKQEEGS